MTFRATVVSIIDGDTVRVSATFPMRLQDVDAPELGTPAGEAAKAYLEDLLPPNAAVTVTPRTEDPHGRVVGVVAVDVARRLLAEGHARPWT